MGYKQLVPRKLLGNGCLADEFPHEFGCLCNECNEVWEELKGEDDIRKCTQL